MNHWNIYHVPEQSFRHCVFGDLHLLVLNIGPEWRIHSFCSGCDLESLPATGPEAILCDSLPWKRFDRDTTHEATVTLRPSFPLQPIVARPASSLTLAPGSSALFYLAVPPQVDIEVPHSSGSLKIDSIPIDRLTKTWHGTKSYGKTCLSLRSPARRRYKHPDHGSHNILVPIDLVNRLRTPFSFDRLYLETGHFGIFRHGDQLFSNAARLRIEKEDRDRNALAYTPRPISPHEDAEELTPPRDGRARRSFLENAFSSLF
ncbi:MAG: hypothetical protein Q7Q71_10425 [Verrucomicrobiota bacterium JB023]|nr:hypothetical protein [Verrucomicrobiota bacterium JB023]